MEQERRYMEEDEITLKEIILKGQEYFREMVRNWKGVTFLTFLFAGIALYQTMSKSITYNAELTFMVNEDEGNSIGGVSAILGQFGLGGGSRGKNNLDKILELARSRQIIQGVMFEKVIINDKSDYLANHVIKIYDLEKEMKIDDSELYFTTDSVLTFKREQLRVLKNVYSKIIGSSKVPGLLRTSYAEKTGIMNLSVKSTNEDLSIVLCKKLYLKLSNFYVNKSVEKQQQTFDVMFGKVDSLKKEMDKAEYSLARFIDRHRGLINSTDRLEEIRLKRDVQILNETYVISLKNFEIADFSLKSKTPFIQEIDIPIEPLVGERVSKIKKAILGGVLGCTLSLVFIFLRKIYSDAVGPEN